MQEQNGDKNRLWSDLAKSGQDVDSGRNIKHKGTQNQINSEDPIKNRLHISLGQLLRNATYQVQGCRHFARLATGDSRLGR
jgi:hypothetical protein